MTFAEFKTAARAQLPLDNRRQGVQAFIDAQIVNSLIDVQYFVPLLRPDPDGPIVRTFAEDDAFALFNENTAEAVALRVKAQLARISDNDLALNQSLTQEYMRKRQMILIDVKENAEQEAQLVEVTRVQGSLFIFDIAIEVGETPINIIDWRIWLTVKRCAEQVDADALLALSTDENTIDLADAAIGVAKARGTLPADGKPGRYRIYMKSIDDSGNIKDELKGFLILKKSP